MKPLFTKYKLSLRDLCSSWEKKGKIRHFEGKNLAILSTKKGPEIRIDVTRRPRALKAALYN